MTYKKDEAAGNYIPVHLGLVVANAEVSAHFYENLFGFTVKAIHALVNLKIINIQSGSLTIELLEYHPAPPQRGAGCFDHIAFMVPNIDLAITRLRSEGVRFETEAPRSASNGKTIIFLAGPDGERIELMQE